MKKVLVIWGAAPSAVLNILAGWGFYCDNVIKVTPYSVPCSKNGAELRFAVLCDLHSKEYGKDNADLVKLVSEQKPDFIAVCGDMINRRDSDIEKMKTLLRGLAETAPTFCCLGNHERDNIKNFGTDFKAEIASAGAVLLDNEYVEFKKGGKTTLIGGLSDYPYHEFYTGIDGVAERNMWEDFAQKAKNNYTVLLHHQPEYIAGIAGDTDIDVIVCGHTHGGQIRLPLIGGILAPNQGFFPKYDKGMFDLNGTKMIISAGLANTTAVPRFNNRVEICVVDVK